MFLDPTDLQTTTSGIFLTRWITYHAPTFMFLREFPHSLPERGKTTGQLSWFLLTRPLAGLPGGIINCMLCCST